METKSREKAKNTRGHTLGDQRESVLGGIVMLSRGVNPTRFPYDMALPKKAVELCTRNATCFYIRWTHKAHLLDYAESSILSGNIHHRWNYTIRRGLNASPCYLYRQLITPDKPDHSITSTQRLRSFL